MVVTCVMFNCGSRADRDHALGFFRVPSVKHSVHYPQINELSKKRRELWIAAIKRNNLTESILKYQRVCSRHFHTGKPSTLTEENHPDWVPSLHLGNEPTALSKRKTSVGKIFRVDKRRKITKITNENLVPTVDTNSNEENILVPEKVEEDLEEVETGGATQTTLTDSNLSTKLDQLESASKKLSIVEKQDEKSPLGLMDNIENNCMWKYYTGFDYKFINTILFPEIGQYVCITSTTELSAFNQVLLSLVKLRLNLDFEDLAFRFKVSATTATTCFQNIVCIMYARLKPLIIWPEPPQCNMNIPECFRETFQENTTVIIDCLEVLIEKPDNRLTQQQCWSNYKQHNTIKFLIGITPQGSISYISEGWGGRTSARKMVELSDFLNHTKPGDVVLADRGFNICETLGSMGQKLVIPAFKKGKNQLLHPTEMEETRHIAHVRIHVERIIGIIKNKFEIFNGPLPISMLKVGSNEVCILDMIVTVCSALINLLPSVVSS